MLFGGLISIPGMLFLGLVRVLEKKITFLFVCYSLNFKKRIFFYHCDLLGFFCNNLKYAVSFGEHCCIITNIWPFTIE